MNIPFYLHWAKNHEDSEETFLYQIKGKYTYANVLEQVGRIEDATGVTLSKQRRLIESLKRTCDKRNVPLRAYKAKIHGTLKEEAFGHPMSRKAFGRMALYSKITAIWDFGIIISMITVFINAFDYEGITFETVLYGTLLGFISGVPFWILAHKVFNQVLKVAAKKRLKKKKSYGYLQVAMAHFYGCTGGIFWSDLHWKEQSSSSYLMAFAGGVTIGAFGSGSSSGIGGFGGGGFGGGGAGGSW